MSEPVGKFEFIHAPRFSQLHVAPAQILVHVRDVRRGQAEKERSFRPLYDLIVREERRTSVIPVERDAIMHHALPTNQLIAPDRCLIYFFTRNTDMIVAPSSACFEILRH